MEFILGVWLPLSLATAIFSLFQLFYPIMNKLSEDHPLKEHFYITKTLWFVLATVIAPILIPAIVVEQYRIGYIEGFLKGANEL